MLPLSTGDVIINTVEKPDRSENSPQRTGERGVNRRVGIFDI